MENKLVKTVGKVYFIAVAVLMYYFLTETIDLGVFVTYRHAFALALVASAFMCFLVQPNIARGAALVKPSCIYAMPLFVTIMVSLMIWFIKQVDVDVISRGLSTSILYNNMLSFTLAAAAFLYLFGEKGIWYNLVAILISNLMMIFTIILQYGLGSFLSEFITLIVTFAGETGDIIVQAEIHELAFCLGAYLIYMLLKPRKNIVFYILLALTAFCFVAAFKRIGIAAIVLALGLGWFLSFIARYKKSAARNLLIFFTIMMVLMLIGYVAIIKMDAFSLLEKAGINTSGRADVYNAVDKFYTFTPDFLGNGIGFLTYQLNTNLHIGVAAVHNDFLQYFIDLGFWGYILWVLSLTLLRVCYFGGEDKIDHAILTFSLSVYLIVVSSTDNTMNYPLLTTVLALIMMGHGFDERVCKTERKIFGHVSKINKEAEGGSML